MKMMRMAFAAVLLAGLSTALTSGTAQAQSCGSLGTRDRLEVVLLTPDQQAFCYLERTTLARPLGPIVGLASGETLVGIDYRPGNGVLYGMGNLGGVYTLVEGSGQVNATLTGTLTDVLSGMPVALSGTSFGVDFNPVPDRLRVVSDTGQNLRINVDNGQTNVDGVLSAMGATACAYTNNDLNAGTATVLYTINSASDQLSIQAPPNNGAQNAVGVMTIDAGAVASFDIFSNVTNGVTVHNRALALLATGPTAMNLYEINLESGVATLLPIPGVASFVVPLTGFAIPPVQSGM
jgi:hypothetical protein